jgi:hypothetical protein
MNNVAVGPELQALICLACKANQPVLLVGPTGCGKSAVIEKVAADLGYDYLPIDLSLMEATDLTGLPTIVDGKTSYAFPSFLPRPGTKGLLVFEELSRSPRHVRAPCLQLLTARRLNDYVLPDAWRIVAAMNPATDEYCDADEIDAALRARFSVVNVVPSPKHWLGWAVENNVHEVVRAFVRADPRVFDAVESNPRAWTCVSRLIDAHEAAPGESSGALLALISGLVGASMASAFFAFYVKEKMDLPSPSRIITAYNQERRAVRRLVQQGDTAAVESICRNLLLHLQDPVNEETARISDSAKSNLSKLVADLPGEHAMFMRKNLKWLT